MLNTALIVISGILLIVGYVFIRTPPGRSGIDGCMITATVFAALFLVVYVARYLLLGSKIFPGEGVSRVIYFAILIPHIDHCHRRRAAGVLHAAAGAYAASSRSIDRSRGSHCHCGCTRRLAGWAVYWMLYGPWFN